MDNKTLTFNEYQKGTAKTAIFRESIRDMVKGGHYNVSRALELSYCALGLGEVGEIQGKIKKIIRDAQGMVHDDVKKAIMKELGDLLWYVSETATTLGIELGDVAQGNLEKLASRQERGVLQGEGDNR